MVRDTPIMTVMRSTAVRSARAEPASWARLSSSPSMARACSRQHGEMANSARTAQLRVPSARKSSTKLTRPCQGSGSASACSATALRRPNQSPNSSSISCSRVKLRCSVALPTPARLAISIRLTPAPSSANAWAAAARMRSRFSRASLRKQRGVSADAPT